MENIDVNNQQYLLKALEGSVSPDENHRKQCEEYLAKFVLKEGSVPALMTIMSNAQFEDGVRLSASIILKNRILSHWSDGMTEFPGTKTTESKDMAKSDKSFLLDNLYLCLVSVGPKQKSVRNQCYEILRHVMFHVELSDVKKLLASLTSDLTQRVDSDRVLCALSCLRKLMSKYEYHSKSQAPEVNEVLNAYFGPLLSVAQDSSKIGLANDEAASLIHMVMKIYFSSALLTSPTVNILKDSIQHWMGLLKYVIEDFINWQQSWPKRKEIDITIFAELGYDDEEFLSDLEQFKCLKWALRILTRFISRQNTFTEDNNKHEFFSSFLNKNYSNDFLDLLLKMLKLESESKLVLNDMTHHLVWTYMRHVLTVEQNFHYLLKHNLKDILGVYCLNTFRYNKEDLKEYQENPEGFIQSLSEVTFQFYSNRGSCADFLKELVKSFPSETLGQIKEIITLGFERNDNTVLYSVLSILGHVSDKLIRKNRGGHRPHPQRRTSLETLINKDNKVKKVKGNFEHLQIDGEELLEVKVVGLLSSDDIWIRMRASWLCGCVLRRVFNFRNYETLKRVYFSLLDMISAKELLVAVFASNAIIEVLRMENEYVHGIVVQSISVLLERLFLLMNRIELESVTSVLGEIVDNYAHEVIPFAKDIIINITNNITKNISKILVAPEILDNEGDDDETLLVRWTMLQTLNTIVKLLAPSSEQSREKRDTLAAQKEMSQEKLLLDLNNYVIIINTISNLLKMLFSGDQEGWEEYLDEAALLLANLVRLLDVSPVRNLLNSSGSGFYDFWNLFNQLLGLVKRQKFDLIADFGLISQPLVALAKRDPNGFQSVLENLYQVCLEARESGFNDESDSVLSNSIEVCLNNGAMNQIFQPLLADTSSRVVKLVTNYTQSGNKKEDLVEDNVYIVRLSNILILYYYQNLATLSALNNNPTFTTNLNLLTEFVVKYSAFCSWRSCRKYCILALSALVKNNVTVVDNSSVVNSLVTLLRNAKNDETESEDDLKYSDSDSDDDDFDDDDDDDNYWSDFEFEDSPLNGVSELKFAKQVLLGMNENLETHQLDKNEVLSFLNTV